MEKNVGNGDQIFRMIAGTALLSLIFLAESDWRWLGLVGLIPLATGVMQSCPLYTILGINTCKKEN